MNERRIGMIEQAEGFLNIGVAIEFSAAGNDSERKERSKSNAVCCSGS